MGKITPPFDPKLDADTLQGHDAAYFAAADHNHDDIYMKKTDASGGIHAEKLCEWSVNTTYTLESSNRNGFIDSKSVTVDIMKYFAFVYAIDIVSGNLTVQSSNSQNAISLALGTADSAINVFCSADRSMPATLDGYKNRLVVFFDPNQSVKMKMMSLVHWTGKTLCTIENFKQDMVSFSSGISHNVDGTTLTNKAGILQLNATIRYYGLSLPQ